jgi:hypothetical protein
MKTPLCFFIAFFIVFIALYCMSLQKMVQCHYYPGPLNVATKWRGFFPPAKAAGSAGRYQRVLPMQDGGKKTGTTSDI